MMLATYRLTYRGPQALVGFRDRFRLDSGSQVGGRNQPRLGDPFGGGQRRKTFSCFLWIWHPARSLWSLLKESCRYLVWGPQDRHLIALSMRAGKLRALEAFEARRTGTSSVAHSALKSINCLVLPRPYRHGY